MPNIGPFELLLVLVLALLVLGPGKLPEVGNALGKTIREFRKASSDVEQAITVEPQPATSPAAPAATVLAAPVLAAPVPAAPVAEAPAAPVPPSEPSVAVGVGAGAAQTGAPADADTRAEDSATN